MRRRVLAIFTVLLAAEVVLTSESARADELSVPISLQVNLLDRVVRFERSYAGHGDAPALVVVVTVDVRAVELEWQQRLSLATFTVRGFRSIYRDFIDTRPATADEFAAAAPVLSPTADPSVAVINDNLATIRSVGVSPSLLLRLAPGLQLAGSFNYSHTRRDGQALSVMPSVFGNSRISWQPVPDGVTIAAAAIVTGNRNITSEAIPTGADIGPQFDLTTLSGPIGIANLQFRASMTYVHDSFLPYSVTPTEPLVLFPVSSRLYGFVGLQFDLDSIAAGSE